MVFLIVRVAGVVIAPFLVWVHVFLLGDLNLFNLIDAAHSALVWALVPMGVAFAAVLVRKAAVTIVAALVAGGIDGLLLVTLLHDVRGAYGLAQVGAGPWIGVGGAALMLVAGVSMRTKRPTERRRPTTSAPAGPTTAVSAPTEFAPREQPALATTTTAFPHASVTSEADNPPPTAPLQLASETAEALHRKARRRPFLAAAVVFAAGAAGGGYLIASHSDHLSSPTTAATPAVETRTVTTSSPSLRPPTTDRTPQATPGSTALTRRVPPSGGYALLLPGSWQFKDASYPSDHATHLWWLPNNALEKARIVLSGCVGCVSKNFDAVTPYPQGELDSSVASTYQISPWKLAFEEYSSDDPYPDNGLIIVTQADGRITGSVRVDLWLPQSQHRLATRILNSLTVAG